MIATLSIFSVKENTALMKLSSLTLRKWTSSEMSYQNESSTRLSTMDLFRAGRTPLNAHTSGMQRRGMTMDALLGIHREARTFSKLHQSRLAPIRAINKRLIDLWPRRHTTLTKYATVDMVINVQLARRLQKNKDENHVASIRARPSAGPFDRFRLPQYESQDLKTRQ